jgi:SAM-dependent methyltransferase
MTVGSTMTAAYAGTEFEAMAEARNYYQWILRAFRPFMGHRVLEVGAGQGNFSCYLLECEPEELYLMEPTPHLALRLTDRFSSLPNVHVVQGTLKESEIALRHERLDTVVCVNVLEHIDNDLEALHLMQKLLRLANGRLLLFVPACPFLYNSLDRAYGHFRRYRKPELLRKLASAGFTPLRCQYVNALGLLSWWYVGSVRRRRTLDAASVRWYDRHIIPLVAGFEHYCRVPVGQSLLAVAAAPGLPE